MENKNLLLSIVLPVYNEEASLAEVVNRLHSICSSLLHNDYEIIIVDDASTDNTYRIAQNLEATLIQNPINKGAGYSRKQGMRNAKGQYIFMLDADLTYLPEDLPLILPYMQNYEQISGVRPTDYGSFVWLRLLVKFMARILASIMTLTYIPDLNTGFKLFKRSEMMKHIEVIPNGFSCVSTMTVSHLLSGKKILFVPIRYMPRTGSSKFHPVKDTIKLFWAIFRATYLIKPTQLILFFIHIGLALYALSTSKFHFLAFIAISYFLTTFINIFLRVQHTANECTNSGL